MHTLVFGLHFRSSSSPWMNLMKGYGASASASTLEAAARLFANFVAHTRERCKCTTNNKSCYVEVRMKGLSKTKVKPILNNQQHSKQIQPPVGEQYKKVVDIPAVRSHFGSIAVDAGRVQVCTYGRLLHGQMRSECKQDEGCSMCPNWMQKIRALPGTVRDNVLSFLMLPLSSIYIPMRTLQDLILLGVRNPIGYAAVTCPLSLAVMVDPVATVDGSI